MIDLTVDQEKCIQCGECAKDCPYSVIEFAPGNYPRVRADREDLCIRCQHCLAVCKPGALSILGIDPKQCRPLKGNLPTAEEVETLIMGRRSVRLYKSKPVDNASIDRLLSVAFNAPTGVNNRQVLFSVVRDRDVMDALREEVYLALAEAIKNGDIPAGKEFFAAISRAWETRGKDVLFRDAPHLLVVSAPEICPTPEADGFIALSYVELLAQSMGIGTLWNGFVHWIFTQIVPDLTRKLALPKGNNIVYCMSFGYPAVHYHRVVDHQDARIAEIRWD
ncbi:MAG: nitroreductase family protein [Desulfovibrio sp.]|uniref:nitroreductase family protein n=1 Tax=Desulfovibrio sp. 7SRBS1 TaxID=3378064 RepID=UPI003B3CD3D8